MREHKLAREEVAALNEVGKLLARKFDSEIRDSLIDKGLIEQKLGGLVLTNEGQIRLRRHSR